VEGDERKCRRGEWPIRADAVTRDEREPDPEQQIDERDDRNG
jgi:hypothetical protein